MAGLNQIFARFKTGMKPTEGQFRDTFSSFWHKSEKIPGTQMDGIPVATPAGESTIKIWAGNAEELPPEEVRAGSRTLYIALEEEEA